MSRHSITIALLGALLLAGHGETGAEPSRSKATRIAVREAAAAPPADQAIESRQHRHAPVHQGDQRTFTITGREGARATAATLTERVTSLTVERGVLRAEISATWIATGGRTMTGYAARRVEEVDHDGLVRATNRLDRAPIPGSAIEGVALPRDLAVGRRWTVVLSYQDGDREVTARMKRRVARKVERRAPDGRVLPGVLIKWSETRSRAGGKRGEVERWTGTSVYLEGVGELETRMKRRGGRDWFSRRLAAFRSGR